MKRFWLSLIVLTVLLAGLRLPAQGPAQVALNALVRTTTNNALYVYGVAAGAQGPLQVLGNTLIRTWGSNNAIGVSIAGGTATPDIVCISSTTQDSYWTEVGANNPGMYTGGTACAGGTLRFDWNNSRFSLDYGQGIATTSTDSLLIANATAATAGVPVQMSPRIRLSGTAWNSVGSASETDYWVMENLPATVAGTTTSTLKFGSSIAGGAVTYPMTLTNPGNMVLAGQLNVGSNVESAAAGYFAASGRTKFTAPADGQANFTNNAVNAGIGFDVTTDGTGKVRNRAQNAYGNWDALAYLASGTAITSGTTHLSAGSGMAVANVGANSCGTTAATIAGNNNASVTTVGATSGTQCRIAFTITAATEWDCSANDDTSTIAVRTTPVDTTHTDLIGAFVAGDKVTAICFPR